MNMFRRASLASTLVFALAASGWAAAGSALAETPFDGMSGAASGSARPTALSSADRLSYTPAFAALRRGDIEAARASVQGVNIDEELQQLMLIEQSYAANATVMKTLGEMMDTLLAAVR